MCVRLLVIDGNSIANRAFYGIRLLSTKDGRFTNAIVGFLNILQKLREMSEADHVAVAFDVHAPTFRHQMYADYKAGRKPMPEELRQQMPVLKDVLRYMGYTLVEKAGYEADDILGTLSRAAVRQGGVCFLATGDRDALQLVDEKVTVLLAATKGGQPDTTAYTPEKIMEKYGMPPRRLIDLKALMGDASDNIPGVAGVGEKTALELLHRFSSLDELYSALDTADLRPALRQKLENGKAAAYESYALGTICLSAPIGTDMAQYAVAPMDRGALTTLLTDLELFKWIERLGLNGTQLGFEDIADEPLPEVISEDVAPFLDAARQEKRMDLLFCAPDTVIVTRDGHVAQTALSEGVAALLCDPTITKRTHNVKPLYAVLLQKGKRPAGFVMDTMLAAYLLDPLSSGYALPRVAQQYGGVHTAVAVDTPLLQQAAFFSATADALETAVREAGQEQLLHEVELPLAEVLASMENDGFLVDAARIAAYGEELQQRVQSLETAIYEAVGYVFNLNSPKQLGHALFEDLGLPAKKKTKSGYSTNAEVLEELRTAHPVVDMLLEYRTLSKLKSTYCDGLLKVIGADGRIHSSFNQTETRTGRISSTEPNLQNIPVRQAVGRELRRFFLAEDGCLLCDADYSQIELRVLAAMAGDPAMSEAFNTGVDIHRLTASQVFGIPEEMVTPLMRSRAKAVNFGIVYGIGAHSLSKDIGVSYKEAKEYIDGYFHHFGAVAGFMDGLIAAAKKMGYAETLLGRRRPLPELRSGNAITRSFGERVARNMPIQGTAADIIKIAMVHVYARLREEGMASRLILQVHDELIVEAPAAEAEKAAAILREEMENAVRLSVKLLADVHIGKTWYDAKG